MKDFISEIFYRTARSGGKGGQNVNKVETMVEAWWHIEDSSFVNEEEKALIKDKLKNRINKDGYLIVKSSETRSQLDNKQRATEKMKDMVAQSLVKRKKRKATKPSKSAIEARLDNKRRDAVKKQLRKKDW